MKMSIALSLMLLCTFSVLLPDSTGKVIPASIYAKHLNDVVESTALKWVGANESFTNYEDAVIGAYETDLSGERSIKRPVYVCRAGISMYIAGYLRPSDKMCVVAYEGLVYHRSEYQILMNMGNKARLIWVIHDKRSKIPQGAVSSGLFDVYMVGRVSSAYTNLTYVLGYWDELLLSGYNFVNETNEHMKLEYGEVLVETENIVYEQKAPITTHIIKSEKASAITRTTSTTTESLLISSEKIVKVAIPIKMNVSELARKDENNVNMKFSTASTFSSISSALLLSTIQLLVVRLL